MVIHSADEMTDKHYVVWTNRSAEKSHLCFMQSSVSFFVVTRDTRCYQIFPRIWTTLCSWDDMIHGEHGVSSPAILTTMSIAAQNILTREDNFFIRHSDENTEANYTWIGHCQIDRMQFSPIARRNQFSFS